VLAKYGTKFAALASSGTPGKSAPANTSSGLRPPSPQSGEGSKVAGRATLPPPPGAPTSTMEEAWAALNEAQAGKPADVVEKLWFDTIARIFPNKSNTDLKPHEWGKLKAEFQDEIPM
jgi:hypothetical protein